MSTDPGCSLDSQKSTLLDPVHEEDGNVAGDSSRVAGPQSKRLRTRRGFRLVTFVTALACLSAAGYSIAQSLREADWLLAFVTQVGDASHPPKDQAGPAPAAKDAPNQAKDLALSILETEDPSERCELQVFTDQPAGESIVFLSGPGQMDGLRPGYFGTRSRLAREIVRQAVLLAARDQLNATVRDAAIGDSAPAGRPSSVIEVAALCRRDKLAIRLSRKEGENREVLFERTLRDSERLNDYLTLTRNAEVATRDGLPDVLGKLGVKGKALPEKVNTRLSIELENQLLKMSFLDQFVAIRQLHEMIRTDGSSPWRLHGLARGYANLGVLTDHHWDGAAPAYKARALLYAQRDVAARPGAPVARWNRAYVAAMTGIHLLALNDLEAASRFAKGMAESSRPAPPAWVELVEAHCHFAAEKLAEPRKAPIAEVGTLFQFLTVEYPPNTEISLRAAREAIVANPENFRAHHALCEVGGVANLHVATAMAPRVLTEVIPKRVAELAGVPDTVRKAVKEGEVAWTRALELAADSPGDRAEPSWGALARIIRETRFVFTYRRLDFMANHWNVPTEEYWQEARPRVAEHRFGPFLEELARPTRDPSVFLEVAEKLDTTDFGGNTAPIERMIFDKLSPDMKLKRFAIGPLFGDWTNRDLSQALLGYQSTQAVGLARKLLMSCPNSAYAMGMLVEHAWGETEKQVNDWRKQLGDHPSFIGPLARRYNELGRTEEANALLKRYLELSSDLWAYQSLADQAKAQGDLIRWKSILDDYLKNEVDHGLDHAKIRVEIAEFLMSKGLYGEARPYAEAAAESWASWALRTAQRCAEGQEDWEAAEKWARNRAMRYPSASAYDWLDFCVRTGEGHLQAACDFTLLILDRSNDKNDNDNQVVLMRSAVLMAKGVPDKTFESLHQEIKANASDPSKHQFAMVTLLAAAGQAGDLKLFASTMEQFIDKYKNESPKFAGILSKLCEAIAKGSSDALDGKGIDALIEETPSENRVGPALVVASYFAGAGKPEMAKPYWKLAADKGQSYFWWRLIAHAHLRPQSR